MDDLHQRTGMTQSALSNIENEKSRTRQESIDNISRVLMAEGIHFTSHGVELLQDAVITLDTYIDLLDDIQARKPAEALFMNADERKSSHEVTEKMDELRQAGIKTRLLMPMDCDVTAGDPQQYRRSDLLAARDVTVIYGGRVGFWTPKGVLLMISEFLAEDYRKQFEVFWDHAKPL
ncbi:MAG: helix-turn-helix protein [Micavibrio sp.]|nr:helix-turn-helix protein [Micavibrio sp.]